MAAYRCTFGNTPLQLTAVNGHEGVCVSLGRFGADIGFVNNAGRTAPDYARSEAHEAFFAC
jgi:ankyrin repeat protein